MLFFNKYFLRDVDLRILRKALMVSKSYRIVDYSGNWLHVSQHEKLVRVRGHELDEEFDRLVERTKQKDIKFLDTGLYLWNYDYEKLSREFKRFLKEQDEICYHEYFRRLQSGVSEEEYNRRLERLEKCIPDFTDYDFERYVMLGHAIPTPSYKKAFDSARRAYMTVNGLLKCNINDFTEFVTLTFAQKKNALKHRSFGKEFDYIDGTDFEEVKKAFTSWMHKLQLRAKRKGYEIKYICVWELQRNGNYHFHLLTNTILSSEKESNPDWLDYDSIEKKFQNSVGLSSWEHGKSDVQRISNHARISTYISKYILKSIYNICEDEEMLDKYKGQKKYFTSRGLKKPEVLYADDWNSDDLGVSDPYETEIVNPYNQGVIKNELYTLINKNEKDAIVQIAPLSKTN